MTDLLKKHCFCAGAVFAGFGCAMLLPHYFGFLLQGCKEKRFADSENGEREREREVGVTCTLMGGVAPTPAGLLIGRPFWLSLCLLFSKGLLTVPP